MTNSRVRRFFMQGVRQHISLVGYMTLLFLMTFFVSSSYRGIYADDLPRYIQWADAIYFQEGLEGHEGMSNPEKSIASIFLSASIALAYYVVGHTLLALHLFPFLFALATPLLFFGLLRRILQHDLWAFFGTMVYIVYPTNPVWLNQTFAEPIFVCWFVLTMLIVEYAKEHPRLLILAGITTAFMVTARLFDGLVFTAFTLLAILYEHRKKFPFMPFVFAIVSFLSVILLCPFLFGFSFARYYEYVHFMLTKDTLAVNYVGDSSPLALTIIASKTFIRWYLGGPFAIGVCIILGIGTVATIKKNVVFPVIGVTGYSAFLLFILGGRGIEPLLTRLGSKMLPGLVILLIVGGKTLVDRMAQTARPRKILLSHLVSVLFFGGIAAMSFRTNQAFFGLVADIIPASSLWKIIEKNPPLPVGRQFYSIEFRESVYKSVLGNYRPSYRSLLAKKAWDANEPDIARQMADFSYYTAFRDEQWKTDAFRVEGTSPLWTPAHPDRIGAFPAESDGTVIYKFSFPQPVRTVTISDVHSQWEPGDIVRLWISENGTDWTMQYDDDIRYKKTYYHNKIEYRPNGISALYVKYYFYAGDQSRANDDNRGASLEQFSLAAAFARAD